MSFEVGVWEVTGKDYSLEMITSEMKQDSFDFKTDIAYGSGLGYATYWLKLQLDTVPHYQGVYYVSIENHLLDSVQLYVLEEGKYQLFGKAGGLIPHTHWPVSASYPTFSLTANSLKNPLYVKVSSSILSNMPIQVYTAEDYLSTQITGHTLTGIFYGILVLFFLYNLVIFFQTRNRLFLYFLSYIFWISLTTAVFKGYAYRFLWPEHPGFNYHSPEIFLAFLVSTVTYFAIFVLKLKELFPKIRRLYIGLVILPMFAMLVSFFLPKPMTVFLFNTLPHSILLLTVIVSYFSWRKGNQAALFFFMGWLAMLVGGILFITKDFGILPHNVLTDNTIYAGIMVEILMFSLAVGKIVRETYEEKEAIRLRLIEIHQKMDELQKELSAIQQEGKPAGVAFDVNRINHYLQSPLSKREMEVLELLITGKKNKEISDQLFVSENTVKKHISAIYRKLEVNNRAQVSTRALTLASP